MQPFGSFTPCENENGESEPCISPEASAQTSFLQDTVSGAFTPLVTGCPLSGVCAKPVEEHADVPPGTVFSNEQYGCNAQKPCGPEVYGGSPNLQHVITGYAGLSQFSVGVPASEALQPVDLLPPDEHGVVSGVARPELGYENSVARHAVAEDGSRVAWTGVVEGRTHLYLRLNATRPQSATSGEHCIEPVMGCTVQLDRGLSQGPSDEPVFQDASSEGLSRVFFTEAGDLYAYDTGSRHEGTGR